MQGGILGGHKSAPVSHKHMLSQPSFSSPLINEDLPAGPQLVFTLNNRFFRHQACYSLLPAKTGGQADRVISLCKYKVVDGKHGDKRTGRRACQSRRRRIESDPGSWLLRGTLASATPSVNTRAKTCVLYIEYRAGKAARPASWRKMTQPGEFCW